MRFRYIILISLQGVFILVFHCIGNTEVRSNSMMMMMMMMIMAMTTIFILMLILIRTSVTNIKIITRIMKKIKILICEIFPLEEPSPFT